MEKESKDPEAPYYGILGEMSLGVSGSLSNCSKQKDETVCAVSEKEGVPVKSACKAPKESDSESIKTNSMKKIVIIAGFLITGLTITLSGQELTKKKSWTERHPVELAAGNFAVGLPFKKLFIHHYHPFFSVGTEYYYRNRKRTQFYQSIRIGGYFNSYSTSAGFLNSSINYRYSLRPGLFGELGIGLGYSHLFHPGSIYKADKGGVYSQVRDWGRPSLNANWSITLGYSFSGRSGKPVSVFARYTTIAQVLYHPDIPVLPQNSFQVGALFFLKSKSLTNESN